MRTVHLGRKTKFRYILDTSVSVTLFLELKQHFDMENIKDLTITPISARPASKYYHPIRIEKIQNGIKTTRETGYGMDSVMIVIFNKTRQKLVLVKQFRNAQLIASIKEENPEFDFTEKCE